MADMFMYGEPFVRGFIKNLEELHRTRVISEEPFDGECYAILRMGLGTQLEKIVFARKTEDGRWDIMTDEPHYKAFMLEKSHNFILQPEPESVKKVECQSGCIFRWNEDKKRYKVVTASIADIQKDIDSGSQAYHFVGYTYDSENVRLTSFIVKVWCEEMDGKEVSPYHVVTVDGSHYVFDIYDQTWILI